MNDASKATLPARLLIFALLISAGCPATAQAAIQVLGVQYQQDKYFPEDYCLWHDRQYPGPCSINLNTGQVVKVFLKNTGASSVNVSDVTLAGRSMTHDIRADTSQTGDEWSDYPASIYFANLSSGDLQTLLNAGEPVWFKADPPTIPAGGVGQAVLRLRVYPGTQPVSMGVVTSGGTVTTNITVDINAPALASVGFSADRTKVYLHWRRSGEAAPLTVLMDGVDVTANATTVGDPSLDFGASVLQLAAPLANMSFHVYQGVFADGKRATGALRTWVNPFLYGTWAAKPTSAGAANGQVWVNEATAHGVNVCVMNVASDGLADLMSSASGRQWMDDHGYGVIKEDVASASQILRMWFIRDEPDGREGNITGLPAGAGHNPGVECMWAVARGEGLRAAKTDAPTTVNIDGNLKPYNYWNWGQVPDVFMTDPYYQPELADAYWNNNAQIPLYAKPTQVYATARTAGLACEPNPLHVILYSNKQKNSSTGAVWPFAPPATKRIEAYYALAGGAKGMAYWWYKAPDGLAAGNADALALWKEIGLIGNEIKTAQPMLVTSHPVALPTTATSGVWVRTLAVGVDTLIFLVVNDNHFNDATGCHYTPVANATVSATLPSWLSAVSGFEITAGGLKDVSTVMNGSQLQVNLGTLNVTRMIVVTGDPQLRTAIQLRYDQQVRPGVCLMAPELCVNNPPSIAQQPANQSVPAGGTANFVVVVSGTSPFNYQWQKNSTNLSNGGHYSGSTTATLTVSNAAAADVASYRCVVTNAYGSVTSSVGVLTIGATCSAPTLLNGSFEGGNMSGVATSWAGYQRGTIPANTVWSIQTASPPTEGGLQYQQIANTNAVGGGGVRQNVTGCVIGATYQVSGWMRGNSELNATCTVKVSPSASTDWAAAIDLNPAQTYTGTNWTYFSGNVVATGTNITIWLDGQTTGSQKFKAECFDAVTVACLSAPSTPPVLTQQPASATNCAGTAATFSVVANGSGNTYQWQKDTADLGDDDHYLGCSTATLVITNVGSSDAASYRCRVSNATGWTNSAAAALTVRATTGIAEQPSDALVMFGGTTNFTVAATGYGPLSYQWQKHQTNLADGGHYSGCTTPTLTIAGAAGEDAAYYTCLVSGGCGSAMSAAAGLAVGCHPDPVVLWNGDFEGPTNAPGVGTNWVGYQRAPNPTDTAWSLQAASPPTDGGLQYQQIANSSSAGGGGVRQDVRGCVVGATYQVSGWMRGNSTNATCRVKISPSASTDWSTAVDLNPPQSFSGDYWVPFSGSVVALGTNMTLWLDGQTGGSGLFKAACFDSVGVSCLSGVVPPLSFVSAVLLPDKQVRLVLSGPAAANVTIESSSNLVAWAVWTNLTGTNGIIEVVDPASSNSAQRFYRAWSP